MRLRLALLVLALGGLAAERDASAFCRSTTCKGAQCARDDHGCPAEGLPLFWPTSCVGFSFQRDLTAKLAPEEAKGAVRRALQRWIQAPCAGGGNATLTFAENDDTICSTSDFNANGPNVNVILFRDDDFPYRDEDNTLAKTTVTYDPKTGAILDADIEINAAFNQLTVGDKFVVYDLESIMTHEAGHFIGIAHSDDEKATMFASYATKSVDLRSLEADDLAALCAIYPPDRKASCDPAPLGGEKICAEQTAEAPAKSGGCSIGPGPARGLPGLPGGAAAAGLLLLAGLARRRRRGQIWRNA